MLANFLAGRPAAAVLKARPLPARVILPRQRAQTSCAAAAGQRGDYTKELNDAEKRWEGQVQWRPDVLVLPMRYLGLL